MEWSFFNPTNGPITLNVARFFTSDTQIPLDQLNLTDLPPDDPRFKPIPGVPDGLVIPAGGTFPIPEPRSVALFGLGILGIVCYRWRGTRKFRFEFSRLTE